MLNSYLDIYFEVLHSAAKNRYADDNDIRLLNLGTIALFSKYKLATGGEKYLKDISHAHIGFLLYTLITGSKDTDYLFIGFDRDRVRRQRELTNNKNERGKYQVRIMLKDVFGFAEHQKRLRTV